MVWYGMVALFITVFPSGIFTFKYRKTNFLTDLKSKIETKITKMKRKHLLVKEAVFKNRISLIKSFVTEDRNFCLLIFP